jgi:hypothetical protein
MLDGDDISDADHETLRQAFQGEADRRAREDSYWRAQGIACDAAWAARQILMDDMDPTGAFGDDPPEASFQQLWMAREFLYQEIRELQTRLKKLTSAAPRLVIRRQRRHRTAPETANFPTNSQQPSGKAAVTRKPRLKARSVVSGRRPARRPAGGGKPPVRGVNAAKPAPPRPSRTTRTRPAGAARE